MSATAPELSATVTLSRYIGDDFLQTDVTTEGAQAWALAEPTIKPGSYRALLRCQQVTSGPTATRWRVEVVQGNRDLSGIAASLTVPAVVFDANTADETQLLTAYVDLGTVTLPARAGTLSVASGVSVPVGVRVTRLSAGEDQIRIDALVLLAVDAPRIRSTQSGVVELRQTTTSGDAPPSLTADTALVLDTDQGLAWIESAQGIEAGIPGVRGTFVQLIPGYDNVLYLLQQTGARIRDVPSSDFLSDDIRASTDVELTYIPSFTFAVTTASSDEDPD